MNTITCPKCGARVRADAINCDACRITLGCARANPVEIERVKQEDTRRKHLARHARRQGVVASPVAKDQSLMRQVLLLVGSFVFAFCLGEAVHELGHCLAHCAFGVDVGIRLDPFGGSRILHGSSAPRQIWGITSTAGPLPDTLSRKFIAVTSGMVSFMFLRLLVSSFLSPDLALENTVPLVFALLLASIVVMLYGPLYPILNRISRTEPVSVTLPVAIFSMPLGAGAVMLQLA